jgi:putative RNA 2'-phosphotransferase
MKTRYFYDCSDCDIYLTNDEVQSHLKNNPDHDLKKIFSDKKRVRLSKFLSLILRHKPHVSDLHLKEDGFTEESLDEILKRIKNKKSYEWVGEREIEAIVRLDPKGRFEIKGNYIRARYGHSIELINVDLRKTDIPSILYHGTSERAYNKIKIEGLKPMGRNLVHLTSSFDDAKMVGLRHTGNQKKNLIILQIDSKSAEKEGYEIWQAGKNVFVSNYIPSRYISINNG